MLLYFLSYVLPRYTALWTNIDKSGPHSCWFSEFPSLSNKDFSKRLTILFAHVLHTVIATWRCLILPKHLINQNIVTKILWFFISYTTYCTQRLKKDSINFAVVNLVVFWLPNQSDVNFCEIFKAGLEFSEILLEPYICILKRYLGGNLFIPCRGIVIAGNSSLDIFFWSSIKMQYISYHQTTLFQLWHCFKSQCAK